MSVKAESLDNAERDLDLSNREVRGEKTVKDAIQRMKTGKPTVEDELAALRHRIAAALASEPTAPIPEPECRDCFRRGWRAALRSLEE